ncbi:MAG: MFS transporter [Pseudomonadota bacterium]|nr:MFS transporter [Pseudomonadota bacterium]
MDRASDTTENGLGARLARGLSVFLDKRVLIVLLLGFSSGLPLALSGSTLTLWMADKGVDIRAIGLYALVGIPYTLKFLWAPVVDAFSVPLLGKRLGHRRGWLVLSQLMLMAAVLFLGSLDPVMAPFLVALAALIVATASATQDIVIDAFRVEYLDTDEQAAGMAYYVAAYRVALLVSTAGTIALVAWLEHVGVAETQVWFWGYAAMAALVVVGLIGALMAKEPGKREAARAAGNETGDGDPLTRFARAAVTAFSDFLSKEWAIAILLFVVAFKLCDTFAGVMTGPFVLAIGFDKATYAAIVKGVGLAASLIGGAAGGVLARAVPMSTALWVAAVLQMVSNFVFSWQAWVGANTAALTVTIIVENFTGAIGTVIFVAYLSGLCTSPLHTATQFALLTALAAVGRTTLASLSGFVAASTGWVIFFALTALAALPGFALLWWLQSHGHFAAMDRMAKEARAATAGQD